MYPVLPLHSIEFIHIESLLLLIHPHEPLTPDPAQWGQSVD